MTLLAERADGQAHDRIDRISWQQALFRDRLRRSDLSALVPTWPCRRVSIHVVRNEPFEFIARTLAPFLAYADLEATFSYGSFDDSLTDLGGGIRDACDAVIVWLDMERYNPDISSDNLGLWIAQRVASLRDLIDVPILISTWGAVHDRATRFNAVLLERIKDLTDVYPCDEVAILTALGEEFTDLRMQALSGSRMSDLAILENSRSLGLRWLPAVLAPPVKAIVLDLDDTLYGGTLVEDGASRLELLDAHLCLQRELLRWRDSGIYLALASKNRPEDVEALFATRSDFLVQLTDFSTSSLGSMSKAQGLSRISDVLNISTESMVLLDDNPAELAEVVNIHQRLGIVHATDPTISLAVLQHYPGLFRFRLTEAATRRSDDMAAASLRERARLESHSQHDYLESLEMQLDIRTNADVNVDRLAELSTRVNQFNTGLLRLNATEARRYVEAIDRCVVTVSLRDRFSDSGTIAALFIRKLSKGIAVDEIDISCRALGRRLEPIIIAEALERAATVLGALNSCCRDVDVWFDFRPGNRNTSAWECLERLPGATVAREGGLSWVLSGETTLQLRQSVPVKVADVQENSP